MRAIALSIATLCMAQYVCADQVIPVSSWDVNRAWKCETPYDANVSDLGFVINQPEVVLSRCADSTGKCLKFLSGIAKYRCVQASEAKYKIVQKSKDGIMAIEELPLSSYANDRIQLGGPYVKDVATLWMYLPLSSAVQKAPVGAAAAPVFGLGMSDALAMNHVEDKDAKGTHNFKFRWAWNTKCNPHSVVRPCPENSAGAGREFYVSAGYYELELVIDLDAALGTPVEVKSYSAVIK